MGASGYRAAADYSYGSAYSDNVHHLFEDFHIPTPDHQ